MCSPPREAMARLAQFLDSFEDANVLISYGIASARAGETQLATQTLTQVEDHSDSVLIQDVLNGRQYSHNGFHEASHWWQLPPRLNQ